MSDFNLPLPGQKTEQAGYVVVTSTKYAICISSFLMAKTDESSGSRTAHRFKSFQSIPVRKGISADTGMAKQ